MDDMLERKNMCSKMMKVEQASEKLHATLNNIERRLEKIKNKVQRYWCLLQEYKNLILCDLSGFAPQRRGRYKPRKNLSKQKKYHFHGRKNKIIKDVNLSLIICVLVIIKLNKQMEMVIIKHK